MWQRFTERARRVVFFAQEEASRLGESYVSTEHLLLGLVREDDSIAARILDRMGVRLGRIRREVERHLARGDGRLGQERRLTPRAKRVINLAFEESRLMKDGSIDTGHLLLGLIREGEGIAGRVLHNLEVELEIARRTAREILEEDRAGVPVEQRRPYSGGVGALGILRAEEGRAVVEVAIDSEAFAELSAIRAAKDDIGYQEMRAQGRFLVIPAGARVKRLQTPVDVPVRGLGECRYIRMLDGEFAGRTGWIFADTFEGTGEEEEAFPPEV